MSLRAAVLQIGLSLSGKRGDEDGKCVETSTGCRSMHIAFLPLLEPPLEFLPPSSVYCLLLYTRVSSLPIKRLALVGRVD